MAVSFDLSGEVVAVTGGGRGLGRAIAAGFAEAGATVAILGRDEGVLEAAAAEMNAAGGRVHAFAADVANEDDITAAAARLIEALGAPTVLVNNAGINPWYRRAEDTTLAEWRQIIDVNLTAAFHCSVLFARPMLERRKGSIINITSVAAHIGLARSAAYCASKGGLELLTKSMAIDWAGRGVRVNTVSPGYFETDLTAGLQANASLADKVIAHTPIGRFGTPDELVGACLYLASDASSYVTGQSIRVDGGFTAS